MVQQIPSNMQCSYQSLKVDIYPFLLLPIKWIWDIQWFVIMAKITYFNMFKPQGMCEHSLLLGSHPYYPQ